MIHVTVLQVAAALDRTILGGRSTMALVDYTDGRVLADTYRSHAQSRNGTIYVDETDLVSSGEYERLRDAVDFSEEWTLDSILDDIKKAVIATDKGLLTAYPVPVPPIEYDPSYRPEWMIVHLVPNSVFNPVSEMDDKIDDDVFRIVITTVAIGVFGAFATLMIVWCVARMLAQPLRWIENIAHLIVNHAETQGADLKVTDGLGGRATMRCAPETEISALVSEFNTMITGFSGPGASSVSSPSINELKNEVTWQSDFALFYGQEKPSARSSIKRSAVTEITFPLDDDVSLGSLKDGDEDVDFPQKRATKRVTKEPSVAVIVPAPPKYHFGPNILTSGATRDPTEPIVWRRAVRKSLLFWWILALIVVPLLMTNVVICAISSINVANTIPLWIDVVEEGTFALERASLSSLSESKARVAKALLYEVIRDVHMLTRVSGWLLSGALGRSGSLSSMDQATEECKSFGKDYMCPYFSSERATCPCLWDDRPDVGTCSLVGEREGRELQAQLFVCEAHDTDPETGDRFASSSFPIVNFSPESTLWWNDTSQIPGSEKGANASGFRTTYDRLRVISAMAVVEFPMFNAPVNAGQNRSTLGTYVSFEADGLMAGWSGCNKDLAQYSQWSSSEENLAYLVRPELCPLGKYGYDPRCRSWYPGAIDDYRESGYGLHVTPPYIFAGSGITAESCTAPVLDSASDEIIGVILYDFLPFKILESFKRIREPVSFMIVPIPDIVGGDTVIGPNKTKEWTTTPILDLLFPFESTSSANRESFEASILVNMKEGKQGLDSYTSVQEDGRNEDFILAFSPVEQRTMVPVNNSNYGSGVIVADRIVYSIGIGRYENALRQPFDEIEDDVNAELSTTSAVFLSIVAVVSLLFTVLTCIVCVARGPIAFVLCSLSLTNPATTQISVHVTRPIMVLLDVLRRINEGKSDGNLPPLPGGSVETRQVYNSFAKLYKIVRVSNTAFFAGNLSWAYHFISDALSLFRKVDDQKAIGIACNNMGNTLYALSYSGRQNSADESRHMDMAVETFGPSEALRFYDEAILIGQRQFDEESSDEDKAFYAAQLADRHFNRAMYLLYTDGRPGAPPDARARGLADLARAREIDHEVRNFWVDKRLLFKNSAPYFHRLVRRIHALATRLPDREVEAIWDPMKLVDEADRILFAAWRDRAPLFDAYSRAGRLQQLEGAVIQFELARGNYDEAARLAMRSMVEDEFLLESAFQISANAVLQFIIADDRKHFSAKTASSVRRDLRRMMKACKYFSLDLGKCVVFAMELGEVWQGHPLTVRINKRCLELYDKSCRDIDFVGVVGSNINGKVTKGLLSKGDDDGSQRKALDMATTTMGEMASAALPFAFQVLVESSASSDNDSFIILFTDGFSWDSEAFYALNSQIERLNRERSTTIHIIIIGIDIDDEAILDQCSAISAVSKQSFFVECGLDDVDSVFDRISSSVQAESIAPSMLGITMEKF